MSLNPTERAVRRVRHQTRFRLLQVLRVQDLSAQLRRITLGGADLAGFTSLGADDHIKLFFFPPGVTPAAPALDAHGQATFPAPGRPPMRDYTPRRFDERKLELDIEFVLHGSGPAAAWASSARPGSTLLIGGPRGSAILPQLPGGYVLIADESGLPALARRVDELAPGVPVRALIEVADREGELPLGARPGLDVTWVHRDGREPGEQNLLLAALRREPQPMGDVFAWVACESAQSRQIRHALLLDFGLADESVKSAGYWKRGVADHHD